MFEGDDLDAYVGLNAAQRGDAFGGIWRPDHRNELCDGDVAPGQPLPHRRTVPLPAGDVERDGEALTELLQGPQTTRPA